MDYTAITQAISTLGFPIVVSAALYWLVIKNNEQHKEEMAKITEALNNNTVALTKLAERMDTNG